MGKSQLCYRFSSWKTGHPHVGGEIETRASMSACLAGPSPRGWGNHDPLRPEQRPLRAIPTWVGKSRVLIPTRRRRSGHPHVGGEIYTSCTSSMQAGGPSPRGWGNRCGVTGEDSAWRAIPTWVGKSRKGAFFYVISAGHPHVGGEIIHCTRVTVITRGPSPRGWGNHCGAGSG